MVCFLCVCVLTDALSGVCLQATVYEHSGEHLEIELFDEDPDKDDFLGRYSVLTGRYG